MIEILGKPMPLQRPRAGKHGFYDPQMIAKRNFAYLVKEQHQHDTTEAPVSLYLKFFFSMPKAWSIKKKNLMRGADHTQTPDLSNLIKFVEDALIGTIWVDDRTIYQITAHKIWGDVSKTIIKIFT